MEENVKQIVKRRADFMKNGVYYSKSFTVYSDSGKLTLSCEVCTVFPPQGENDGLATRDEFYCKIPSFGARQFFKAFREFEFFGECQKNG